MRKWLTLSKSVIFVKIGLIYNYFQNLLQFVCFLNGIYTGNSSETMNLFDNLNVFKNNNICIETELNSYFFD